MFSDDVSEEKKEKKEKRERERDKAYLIFRFFAFELSFASLQERNNTYIHTFGDNALHIHIHTHTYTHTHTHIPTSAYASSSEYRLH